jgi:hypothetical protein
MRQPNKISSLLLACALLGFFAAGASSAASGCPCEPGDECPIKGEVCCPHEPGFGVPFTCSTDPCYRGGEPCEPGDECPIEGQLCCPHAPGPTQFTCDYGDCFR